MPLDLAILSGEAHATKLRRKLSSRCTAVCSQAVGLERPDLLQEAAQPPFSIGVVQGTATAIDDLGIRNLIGRNGIGCGYILRANDARETYEFIPLVQGQDLLPPHHQVTVVAAGICLYR